MTFYQGSLNKFLQFLGRRADEPMGEITKQDVVAFRDALLRQVSAKTVNHDLKALKMLFKSATEDPTQFVETVRKERGIKIKRPFTLPELRGVLNLANDEWRSMILFGLYTGQRLGDIATLRWNNLGLARGELRLSTRKTGKAIVLTLAASLRRQIGFSSTVVGLSFHLRLIGECSTDSLCKQSYRI
jgi:integrase